MSPPSLQQDLQLAIQHHQAGRLSQAEQLYRQILAQQPNHAEALHLLGVLASQAGRFDVAVDLMRRAIALKPNFYNAHYNLGNALRESGHLDEAIAAFRQTIALKPDHPEAHSNLANALRGKGQLDESIIASRKAIALKPKFAQAYMNLGNTLRDAGLLDQAVAAYRDGLAHDPDSPLAKDIHSNICYTMHFQDGVDPPAILTEHRLWNQHYSQPLRPLIQSHPNDRHPDRRLRIGYVSPDFRNHVVARYLLPLFANHDHQSFEIFAYSHVPFPDVFTEQLRAHTDQWRNIVPLSDEQAAQIIRDDRIDILVDLSVHMANNRLLVFARKPAPVQITWLGYCSTTGLDTIDYRLTDPYLDPPGIDESVYTEKTFRLPQTYWCYQPRPDFPEPGSLPALSNAHITFGCLNNFNKVSDFTLGLWIKILADVPSSHLILYCHPGSHRTRVLNALSNANLPHDRIEFTTDTGQAYFKTYHRIDVALDPFPCGGVTTTCDALWMCVPVVSLAGATAVSRSGFSILSNTGLPDLVATAPEQYVQIATALANDLSRLAHLRATLRTRMQNAPLMNAKSFAHGIESAYRTLWRQWCTTSPL